MDVAAIQRTMWALGDCGGETHQFGDRAVYRLLHGAGMLAGMCTTTVSGPLLQAQFHVSQTAHRTCRPSGSWRHSLAELDPCFMNVGRKWAFWSRRTSYAQNACRRLQQVAVCCGEMMWRIAFNDLLAVALFNRIKFKMNYYNSPLTAC